MKLSLPTLLSLASITALAFSSCVLDPDYRAFKEQQKAQAAQPSSNPYGVPQPAGEVGTYTPAGSSAPYQPLPGVNPAPTPQPPINSDPPITSGPGSSSHHTANLPAGGGISHTVVPGDSLWRLAKKNHTTVEAIQAANGITGTNIRLGQKLIIPSR